MGNQGRRVRVWPRRGSSCPPCALVGVPRKAQAVYKPKPNIRAKATSEACPKGMEKSGWAAPASVQGLRGAEGEGVSPKAKQF